ncbi:MAG: hypothetical protein GXP08_14965 [Gammaproteobacteria bacterium]|nr:hypothetical protein [Gammaproteobacteria bacterium]
MLLIFKLFIDICLLRANAENIPSSRYLLMITLTAYFSLSLGIALHDNSTTLALSTVLVGLLMMIGFAQAGLWIRNFLNRSTQTITALAGTGVIFDLMSWPLIILAAKYSVDEMMFPRYLLFILLFWNITVIGHILRNALSIPFWAGIGISLLYVFTYLRVIRLLFIAGS